MNIYNLEDRRSRRGDLALLFRVFQGLRSVYEDVVPCPYRFRREREKFPSVTGTRLDKLAFNVLVDDDQIRAVR